MMLRIIPITDFCPVIHISPNLLKIITADLLNFQAFTESESKTDKLANLISKRLTIILLRACLKYLFSGIWILLQAKYAPRTSSLKHETLLLTILTYYSSLQELSLFKILWYIDYDSVIRDFGDLCKKTKSFIFAWITLQSKMKWKPV